MDFRVGEDQRELAEGIRTMVAGRLPLERLRAREGDERAIGADDWAALGETGVFALTVPEPVGTGLGMADAVVVFEELGRALVPGPLVGTFLAARAGLVEGAAEGRAQVGVHCDGAGPILVEHLASLDALLVLGPGDDRRALDCWLRPRVAAVAGRIGAPLDPLTPLWRLEALPDGEPVAEPDGRLWRDGALLTARCRWGTRPRRWTSAVAYAKERHQFGKPIGSFQAVKHMCADMLVRAEVARAACARRGLPGRRARRRRRRRRTPPAARRTSCWSAPSAAPSCWPTRPPSGNARAAIQVHGGMGFTWEVPLHLHLKRARVLSTTFGTPAEQAAALAAYA